MPTFADAAERVWNQMRQGWHDQCDRLSSLTCFACPHIGYLPVGDPRMARRTSRPRSSSQPHDGSFTRLTLFGSAIRPLLPISG